jgi:hypothetical protein
LNVLVLLLDHYLLGSGFLLCELPRLINKMGNYTKLKIYVVKIYVINHCILNSTSKNALSSLLGLSLFFNKTSDKGRTGLAWN